MMTRLAWGIVLLSFCVPAGGCGDGGNSEPEPEWIDDLFFAPSVIGLLEGDERVVKLKIQSTPAADLTVVLTAEDGADGVAGFPAEVVFAPGEYVKDVPIQALSLGTTTITATYDGNPMVLYTADLEVYVGESGYTCDGSASGTLSPGGRLEMSAGGAFVAFGDDERFSDVDATIDCADDIVPEGYIALGPAITFGPVHARYMREAEFGVPVNAAMMPETASIGHVRVFYEGPGVDARVVPVANGWIEGDPTDGLYTYLSPRFGTYQAAVEEEVGSRSFERRYTFRGITGVSMGGGGAALVGLRNHDRFDFVSPLGGPANWTAMMHYIQSYHLGGFCTALDDDAGDVGEHCDPRPPAEIYEFGQEFENWFYHDGWDGQGGTFNREDYCQIFRDITRAFGNPGFYNEDSPYMPPGVTWEWMQGSRADKCGEGGNARLTDFYDRLYNPDGSLPVITFCDGAEWRDTDGTRDVGRWDPAGDQYYPLDIALAVDVNDNGMRDAHEPVISQSHEPYDDVGSDGLASADEEGYDAVTNPDPAGDDYDYQFNPSGTEYNHLYEEGEPYLDYGLDGVDGTPQQPAGYDWGEGNGQFDYNPNIDNLWEHDAKQVIEAMSDEELRRIDVFTDAGIRDLFDFAPGENGILGALAASGQPVGLFRNFASLYGSDDEEHFDSTRVDYLGLPKNYIILYGDEDADEDLLQRGDGGHVGTASQVLNRLGTVTMAMSARWPGGDREDAVQDIVDEYLITFDFESHDRMSQTSIFLPPGYHQPENLTVYYPVVYFLHGYGQEPNDLILSAIVFGNNMISDLIVKDDRMQKVIMVFPDGRCRFDDGALDYEKECQKGSFYADSRWDGPDPGPQMESILLDLMDYIDATYRTKPEETVTYNY
jgi:S-formylglutathione hydrolase FrmB